MTCTNSFDSTLLKNFRHQASGHDTEIKRRHLDHFLAIVSLSDSLRPGLELWVWLDQMQLEYTNLCAAMESSAQLGKAESGLQMASQLSEFWDMRGNLYEGRAWLERLLSLASNASEATRARALYEIGYVISNLGDNQQASEFCERALVLARESGDKSIIAKSLSALAYVLSYTLDYARGRNLLEEAMAFIEPIGDVSGLWGIRLQLGRIQTLLGDYERAREYFTLNLATSHELGSKNGIAFTRYFITNLDWFLTANVEIAATRYQECLPLFQEIRNDHGAARALWGLASVARRQGDYEQAKQFAEESLTVSQNKHQGGAIIESLHHIAAATRKTGDRHLTRNLLFDSLHQCEAIKDPWFTTRCLAEMAGLAADQESWERSAMLFGASHHLVMTSGVLYPMTRAEYDSDIATVRAQLGEAACEAAWANGRAMSLDQASAFALKDAD